MGALLPLPTWPPVTPRDRGGWMGCSCCCWVTVRVLPLQGRELGLLAPGGVKVQAFCVVSPGVNFPASHYAFTTTTGRGVVPG